MRLRFTIRDLLWLTAVVALAVGWWIDRSKLMRTINSDSDFVLLKVAEIKALQIYFAKKYPNESIDWAELLELREQVESR